LLKTFSGLPAPGAGGAPSPSFVASPWERFTVAAYGSNPAPVMQGKSVAGVQDSASSG
jgi:hypothetical protein